MSESYHPSTSSQDPHRPIFRPSWPGTKKRDYKYALWCKTYGFCWYCGDELHPDDFHADHVVPRSKGGGNEWENMVPSCHSCNLSKLAKSVEEFRLLLQRKRENIPAFSPSQLEWLASRGFEIDYGTPHVFWFEKEGRTA